VFHGNFFSLKVQEKIWRSHARKQVAAILHSNKKIHSFIPRNKFYFYRMLSFPSLTNVMFKKNNVLNCAPFHHNACIVEIDS